MAASTSGVTTTNAQFNKGTPATSSLTLSGLTPGDYVIIGVRAEGADANGNAIVSDYATLPYEVPGTGSDGSNLVAIQNNTDVRLVGGSISLNTNDKTKTQLPKNLGKIDITSTPITGTGIVMNQYGLAAYSQGNEEFLLNAKTGKATFSGIVQAGPTIKIGPQVGPNGENGIYLSANNYWYDDGRWSTGSDQITQIVRGSDSFKPGDVTGLVVDWNGSNSQDLKISFIFDTGLYDVATKTDNTHLAKFVIGLQPIDGGPIRFIDGTPISGINHNYLVTRQLNQSLFGAFQNGFYQVSVVAQDMYGNQSAHAATASVSGYHSNIPVPSISATGVYNGYTVTFNNYPNTATFPDFQDALIEEIIASDPTSTTAPTDGYNTVWEGTISGSPAIKTVLSSDYQTRWVRARYRRFDGSVTDPSTAQKIIPQNPVANNLNLLTPDTPVLGTVTWTSTDDISIPYTATGTSSLTSRFIIILSAVYNGQTYQASFYKYPSGALGANPIVITANDIFNQFGALYPSYTGVVYQEYAETATRSLGAQFTTPTLTSNVGNLTPDITTFSVFGIPSGYIVSPPAALPAGVVAVKVYQADDSINGTYNFVDGGEIKSFALFPLYDGNIHWVKVSYVDIVGNESHLSQPLVVNIISLNSNTPVPPAPYIAPVMAGDVTDTSIMVNITATDVDNGLPAYTTKGYFLQYYPMDNMGAMIMQMIPASNSLNTTQYMISGLQSGTTYVIQAAAYNNSNDTSEYTVLAPNVTTSDTAILPPTNVQVRAIAYGVYVTYDPPSPSTNVVGYSINIYSNTTSSRTTGTLLYSDERTTGLVYSFPGLKGSLYYYAEVASVDSAGHLSSTKTKSSNSVLLNASGGSSDLQRPSSNPSTITVKSFGGALQVNWSAINNPDPVTYEVHVSTTPSFNPNTTDTGTITKSLETPGLFGVVKTYPADGNNLTYYTTATPTTYYITVVAKDVDGYATGSYTYATGRALQSTGADIAANTIAANNIISGSITATQIDSTNLFVGKSFSVGPTGAGGAYAIKIDATGNGTTLPYKIYSGSGLWSDANTAFYLDSAGKFSLKNILYFDPAATTPLTVVGNIQASGGYFTGPVILNGSSGAMKIGKRVDSTSTLDGIYLDASNYWYSTGKFHVGSSTLGFGWDPTLSTPTFTVTGTINATGGNFTGPVSITSANSSGLFVIGDHTDTGPRIVMGNRGIEAFDFTATTGTPSTTWISLNKTTTGVTFYTTNATIGGYTIDNQSITSANTSAPAGQQYYGLSRASTGSAFFAGGPQGGGTTSNFHVGIDGSVVAKNIQLLGDGTTNSKVSIGATKVVSTTLSSPAASGATTVSVTLATGITAGMFVYADGIIPNTTVKSIVGTSITLSQATTASVAGNISFIPTTQSTNIMPNGIAYATGIVIAGTSYLTAARISGNLNLDTLGSIVQGTALAAGAPGNVSGTYPILSGQGFILNKAGLTFANTAGTWTTTLSGVDGALKTISAVIGGWQVNSSQFYSPNSDIFLDANVGNSNTPPSTTSQPAVYAVRNAYYVGITPITSNATAASDVVIWAGQNAYSARSTANFRVYGDGHVYIGGTGSVIDGGVTIGGLSKTITDINSTATSAQTTATSAQTTANTASTRVNAVAIFNANNQTTQINSTGITITGNSFSLNGSGTATPSPGNSTLVINSSGIAAKNSSGTTTFAIDTNGNASFNGSIYSASNIGAGGTLSGSNILIGLIGNSNNAGNYFESNYTRTTPSGTYSVTGIGFGAVGFVSAETGGVYSNWYPYYNNDSSLGLTNLQWKNLFIANKIINNGVSSIDMSSSPIVMSATSFSSTVGVPNIPHSTNVGSTWTVVQDGLQLKVYYAPSSRKYKENILSLDTLNMYNVVKELSPVSFNYKPDFSDTPEIKHLGLIAEEVAQIVGSEELLVYKDDVLDSVNYDKLPMYFVGAIKEMANKINSLQAQLDNLTK
jgi:hypothetical protein